MKNIKKNEIEQLFTRLHFEFGLEDVNSLYMLKSKALKRWCNTTGVILNKISFALAMGNNIDFVMDKADKEIKEIQ